LALAALLATETITTMVLRVLILFLALLLLLVVVMALVVIQQLRLLPIPPEAQVALVVEVDLLELAAQAIRHQQALAKGITEGPVAMLQTVVRAVGAVQAR
jgi:hypothetical protein